MGLHIFDPKKGYEEKDEPKVRRRLHVVAQDFARRITREAKEDRRRIPGYTDLTSAIFYRVREIRNVQLRSAVVRILFGEKTPGDLGLRSTQDHPKTDYGSAPANGNTDEK